MNDKSIGTNIKSQIFTEMMVRNPGGFSTALQQLNKDGSDDILGGILDQVSGDPGLNNCLMIPIMVATMRKIVCLIKRFH